MVFIFTRYENLFQKSWENIDTQCVQISIFLYDDFTPYPPKFYIFWLIDVIYYQQSIQIGQVPRPVIFIKKSPYFFMF